VQCVIVNGRDARSLSPNFGTWEITFEGRVDTLAANAEDAAGNVEQLPHQWVGTIP
jgi:hypothetical protein